MTSRVGRVALTLRLAEHDRDRVDETRRAFEHGVIQQALEELERAVHARYGAATIVRIRKLAFRWQLALDSVDDPHLPAELARDLIGSVIPELEALPRPQRLRPPPETNAIMFADEPHAIAAELADRSEGRTAWFHTTASLPPDAAWAEVVARGPADVATVERWLERMERRTAVARWLEHPLPSATPVRSAPAAAERRRTQPGRAHEIASNVDRIEPAAPAPRPVDRATAIPEWLAPAPEAAAVDGVPTELAGLWYLARLVMELDMAEQLWAAGAREGDVLAYVARAIAGTDDDPSWRWFGGAWAHEPRIDPLPDWALDELATGRAAALARIAPGTAMLDPRSFPDEDPVVATCAAALVTAFCARLGCEPDLERVRAHLRVRGRLELGEMLRVVMSMDAIDIALRRAGLDLDPGHLPWLGRRVDLVYE